RDNSSRYFSRWLHALPYRMSLRRTSSSTPVSAALREAVWAPFLRSLRFRVGTGKEGFVFRLDLAQAAALQTLLNGMTTAALADLRLGVSASASNATGGPETFNVGGITGEVTAVLEPATLLLLGSGLVGLGV